MECLSASPVARQFSDDILDLGYQRPVLFLSERELPKSAFALGALVIAAILEIGAAGD